MSKATIMFGIFGKNKNSKKLQKQQDQPKSREELKAEAMNNARAAREAIGEDTLDKIAEEMSKKQKSNVEKAKRDITSRDDNQIAENLRDLMNDDHAKK